MNRGKTIGICCIVAAVAILAVALIYWQRAEDEDSYGLEPGRATETTSSAVSAQEGNAVQTMETAEEKERPSELPVETEEPEQGEYSVADMDIKDMDEEVLSLMGVTEDRLAKEMKIFANGYGFANVTEVFYYGETVVDHKKNTVSVAFYFELPETGTYKFNVIVQRKKKTFRFEPW